MKHSLSILSIWTILFWGSIWMPCNGLRAQFVDEFTPAVDSFQSVGQDGNFDFLAQSFVADVGRLSKVGAWLKADSLGGEVQLTIFGHGPNGTPDLNYVVFQSALTAPPSIGAWVYDTITSAALSPGDTFWVAIDGYQNFGATGYASVGLSSGLTSSGAYMLGSLDGGLTWMNTTNLAMAIYVEGDNCSVPIDLYSDFPAVCSGTPTTISAPPGFLSYVWSTGATSSELTVTSGGSYSVTVSDQNLCQGSAFIYLPNGTFPNADLEPTYTYCEGDSARLQAYPHFNSYIWSTGHGSSFLIVNQPGIYSVTVGDYDGCISSDTTEVFMRSLPEVDLGSDTALCQGNSLFLDAGPSMLSYFWSTGEYSPFISVSNQGNYWVEVVDSANCLNRSDTIRVEVSPIPDQPVIRFVLQGIESSFGFSYRWIHDGVEIMEDGRLLTAPEPGLYQVEISNGYGCLALSDTFRVNEDQVGTFISEGFSPNGDGLNEVFFVEGIEDYPNSKLVVFNSVGETVHKQEGYRNDWRGTGPSGKDLPDGTYYYVIELAGGTTARKGAVVIHR